MKIQYFWHRSSVAVFALAFSFMISIGLASAGIFSGLSTGVSVATISDVPQDEGGDGYQAGDDCGFLMGVGNKNTYNKMSLDAKNQSNNEQACLDAFAGASTGLFHSDVKHKSYVTLTDGAGIDIVIDLAPSSVAVKNRAQVDLATGQWSGYGKIVSSSAGAVQSGDEWVWFDWVCTDTANCVTGMSGKESQYWVNTAISTTGLTDGYAWSDYLFGVTGDGFIEFAGTAMETPPKVIVPYIEVEANQTDVTPSAADRDTAPQANGVDYWRVGIYFVDMVTGQTLDESSINTLTMSVNTTDSVFIDQVTNSQNAVDVSTWHPTACPSGGGNYCVLTKEDGTVTFNQFVRSYGPTSNLVYMTEEVAMVEQDMPTDRDGCLWFYLDQLNVYTGPTPRACATDTSLLSFNSIQPSVKWDYFYARSEDRNYIYLDDISFYIDLNTDQDYTISTDGSFVSVSESGQNSSISQRDTQKDGQSSAGESSTNESSESQGSYYLYTPNYTELSFSPRFYLEGLYAEYDGAEWTDISTDLMQKDMFLNTSGGVYPASKELTDYLGLGINDSFDIYYQLDASTGMKMDINTGDVYLVMDPTSGSIDDPAHNDSYHTEAFPWKSEYYTHYAMGYGQLDADCGSSSIAGSSACEPIDWGMVNYIENPTAEIWVCDKAVEQVIDQRTNDTKSGDNKDKDGQSQEAGQSSSSEKSEELEGKSCYYVGYLPVIDNHADPGGVMFMGSTNEFLGLSLEESEDIYEGGAEETSKLRDNFYELGTRYTSGVDAGPGVLDLSSSSPIIGDGYSLMGGSLYYFQGDVHIREATSFTSSTVYVLGGDVYIDGNIGNEDSRLGIVVMQDAQDGGNVYISEDVTDVYVNIFADNGVYSASETYDSDGVPSWLNDAYRMATLKNQLYINGSISARMILNADDVYSNLGFYTCGGGEVSEDVANECSLEKLRQFRLCYELDSTGTPTSTLEMCDEDEQLSAYGEEYAATASSISAEYYPSVILDYTAPGNLPIFASEGIFN